MQRVRFQPPPCVWSLRVLSGLWGFPSRSPVSVQRHALHSDWHLQIVCSVWTSVCMYVCACKPFHSLAPNPTALCHKSLSGFGPATLNKKMGTDNNWTDAENEFINLVYSKSDVNVYPPETVTTLGENCYLNLDVAQLQLCRCWFPNITLKKGLYFRTVSWVLIKILFLYNKSAWFFFVQ